MVPTSCCNKILREEDAIYAVYDDGSKWNSAFCKPCFDARHIYKPRKFMHEEIEDIRRWAASVEHADEFPISGRRRGTGSTGFVVPLRFLELIIELERFGSPWRSKVPRRNCNRS